MTNDTSRFQVAQTHLTLGPTSASECEHNVEEPVAELHGVATQTDMSSVCIDGARDELHQSHQRLNSKTDIKGGVWEISLV